MFPDALKYFKSKYAPKLDKVAPNHSTYHSIRTAMYIELFHNLHKEHNSAEEIPLKLLQIAMVFHDSAREGDKKDYWECQSANNFINYCEKYTTYPVNIIHYVAHELLHKDVTKAPKSYIKQLLHDADCLDMLRYKGFDKTYLDFYKEHKYNDKAMEDLSLVIEASRNLIKFHGEQK